MKKNTHAKWVFFLFTIAISGCSSLPPEPDYSPPPQQSPTSVAPRKIGGPTSIGVSQCRRQSPDPLGRRAFFGIGGETCRDTNGQLGVYMVTAYYIRGKSPAINAGLEVGDRIVSINGCRVREVGELTGYMQEFTPGNAAQLEIERDGRRKSFIVTTIEHTPTEANRALQKRPVLLCSTIGRRDR